MLCAAGEHSEGAVGHVWVLRAWGAGVGAAPSAGTNAIPPRFKRNAYAALMAVACMYQISSYLSNPGAFPKSSRCSSYTFPCLAPGPRSVGVFPVCPNNQQQPSA